MAVQISFTQLSLLVIFIGIVQWLLALWIKTRLEKSIQHEYDKQIEDYKFSQLRRQKAELIARLFAKWGKYHGKEKDILDKDSLINYYEDLNRMSYELSLWLDDAELLNDIMNRFKLDEKAKDNRTLIGSVRKLILGKPDDTFNPLEIILWPNQEISDELFK